MKPIHLKFKPSITFTALFSLMIVSACCIVMLLAIASQIKFILLVLIISIGSYAVLKHGLRFLPSACVALKIDINNQLKLIRKDGKILEVSVQENTTVTPYLTVLNSQIKERSWLKSLFKQHLVIFPDAVDAEHYRQLRVWLRWGYQRNHQSESQ